LSITPSDDEVKAKIRAEISEYSKRDVLNVVLKSTVGALPGIGSAISELVEVIIPKTAFERLVDFAIDLRNDLERLKSRINSEYLKSEEVAYMFRETMTTVLNDYHKEKLDALRAAFLNSIIDGATPAEVKELYLNLAKNLTVSHIKLLRLLDNPEEFLTARRITYRLEGMGGLIQILRVCLPEFTEDQITLIWNDLRNYNMVNTETSSLRAMMSNLRLDQLNRLTSFGRSFVGFLKMP